MENGLLYIFPYYGLASLGTVASRDIRHLFLILANPFRPSGWKTVCFIFFKEDGGGSRIRTHESLAALAVFKTAAFDHSAIPPH